MNTIVVNRKRETATVNTRKLTRQSNEKKRDRRERGQRVKWIIQYSLVFFSAWGFFLCRC
ncbi:hypothetical protein BO86DRAFT_19553 [Aspergillus japonicus CBS 114.51]|uniref:Uncharacterized protein n=1 Tax=Aspergillus japonicus CBS 114.51 TaxID=1448312 RepID=A0A8T8WKC3_ASPJA|nr:hypothetical protein BO86DRAFT_19553 [Aspergillus japonicus CBS 114.51]RAH76308.1 hypothetical protein BO86DRAFT_19553 [Aspergillus japonicus CBS 114.51]